MNEQNNEQVNEVQDPAEPKQVDEAVQTAPQPVDAGPGNPPLVSEERDQDSEESTN